MPDIITILTWVALGFVAGIIAKFILPGRQGGGFILTTILGIGGAFLGGWLGSFFGIGTTGGFSIASVLTAVVGALVILILFGLLFKRK